MNKNPYSVLGVSENATDEEISKAYKELVKKYHPDKYANSDLAELANEKMSEINVAYEQIQKMRKNGGGSGNYSGNNSGYSGSSSFMNVRMLINSRRFSEALSTLNSVEASQRNAEWNFLYGLCLYSTGRVFDAVGYIDRACAMDPGNLEYRGVRDRISGSTFTYNNGGDYRNVNRGCSGCDVCTSLLCADCCCECMGGDLIRCC